MVTLFVSRQVIGKGQLIEKYPVTAWKWNPWKTRDLPSVFRDLLSALTNKCSSREVVSVHKHEFHVQAHVQACFSQKVQFVNQWLWRRFGLVVCNPKISLEIKLIFTMRYSHNGKPPAQFDQWSRRHEPVANHQPLAYIAHVGWGEGLLHSAPLGLQALGADPGAKQVSSLLGCACNNTLHYNKISIILQPPTTITLIILYIDIYTI